MSETNGIPDYSFSHEKRETPQRKDLQGGTLEGLYLGSYGIGMTSPHQNN